MGSFDPTKHLIQLKGKWYLETKYRIQWFREDHPRGCISTEVVSYDPILVKATIYSAEGEVLATAHAGAVDKGNAVWSGKTAEKAETAAIGRALGHAGYGTQFAASPGHEDTDHRDGELADSPVERRNRQRDAQADRQRLGNSGPRRVNTTTDDGVAAPSPAREARSQPGGSDGAGQPPAPNVTSADDLRNRAVAEEFMTNTRAKGISDADVLAALGVSKLSDWTQGRKAAGERVKAWQAGKLADNDDVTSHDQRTVFEGVKHLFNEPTDAGKWKHCANTYNKLVREGVVRAAMSNDQVIAKIAAYKAGTPVEDMAAVEAI